MRRPMIFVRWFLLLSIWTRLCCSKENTQESITNFFSHSGHTNNWAVLVGTSRYWFNYRHVANTLSVYRSVKRMGIADDHIILMLPDDIPCNPRNIFPGSVINSAAEKLNLYGDDIEVDYRGNDVTVERFIRMMTGRTTEDTPRSKKLLTDEKSNILVYMTGHGGNEFLKFQDAEELGSRDLADVFEQMWQKKRYHEILFIIDTCQATTMYKHIYSPNILALGSSSKGESSYSHHSDLTLGVAVIDRLTHHLLDFLEHMTMDSKATMADFMSSLQNVWLQSRPGLRTDLFSRTPKQTYLTDFFGNVQNVELTRSESIRPSRAPVPVAPPKIEPKAPVKYVSFTRPKSFELLENK